jgi:hypothetical protein
VSVDNTGLAQIAGDNTRHGGFYSAFILTGPASSAFADSIDAGTRPLQMPEGQTVPTSESVEGVLYNMMENGHNGQLLRAGSFVPILRTAFDAASRKYVMATCMPSFEHAFWVDLVQDGGNDGSIGTPVSYTYTATFAFSSKKAGTKLSPKIRISKQVPTTVARMGLGCFLGPTFALIITDEFPAEDPCT